MDEAPSSDEFPAAEEGFEEEVLMCASEVTISNGRYCVIISFEFGGRQYQLPFYRQRRGMSNTNYGSGFAATGLQAWMVEQAFARAKRILQAVGESNPAPTDSKQLELF